MTLRYPVLLGNLSPSRAMVRLARTGQPLDFTNGVAMEKLPPELLALAAQHDYAPADPMVLALHGRGSVTPHTDGVFSEVTLMWLVADTALSYLMVADGGDKGVLSLHAGDVVLFPNMQYHAWVSRSSWAMFVTDVTTDRAEQHKLWRLPAKNPAPSTGSEGQAAKT